MIYTWGLLLLDVRFPEQCFCRNHLHYLTANHFQLLGRFKNTQHTEDDGGEKRYFFAKHTIRGTKSRGPYILPLVHCRSYFIDCRGFGFTFRLLS